MKKYNTDAEIVDRYMQLESSFQDHGADIAINYNQRLDKLTLAVWVNGRGHEFDTVDELNDFFHEFQDEEELL